MKHRIAWGVAIVVMAVGIGFLAGRGTHPTDVHSLDAGLQDAPGSGAEAGADAASAAFARQTPRFAPDAPLPEFGTPLVQIHDALVRRAAAGEARAACRLAAEHEHCENARIQLRNIIAQQERAPTPGEREAEAQGGERFRQIQAWRAEQAEMRRQAETLTTQCDAAPSLSPEARARYWRQAALAGHVPSMRHYASGNAFRWHDLMDALPTLQVYRREAESIARRAAMHGDVGSMYALAMAYADLDGGGWRPFLSQTITPDLGEALAWFSALERHPAIIALSEDHPAVGVIRLRRAELDAAATPEERGRAARLAAAVALPMAADRRDAVVLPNGAVADLGITACDSAHFVNVAPALTGT